MIEMARGSRVRSKTGVYHIMLRGNKRQEIFHDDSDCLKFLDTIQKYKTSTKTIVYAWCLMNNHVHLLLKEGKEDISKTMKRINVSFVHYYNQKYNTTGHLFQDRFKSEPVETDEYLLTVVRYIHQNPVKAGLVEQASDWKWSSCCGYYGKSISHKSLLDTDFILKLFADDLYIARKRFRKFNEQKNDDKCLDYMNNIRKKLSDEEARLEIGKLIGTSNIAQVKNLPKIKRDEVLQKIKKMEGITQRQAARILGISPNLIFKA